MKQKKGITLVSLVITIVVILIISGVAISVTVDSNGIFSKGKEASNKWKQGTISEEQSIVEILIHGRTSTLCRKNSKKYLAIFSVLE